LAELRERRVHLLEPQRRPAPVGIEQVFVTKLVVPEHGPPEGQHFRTDERIDRHLNGLHGGRVGDSVQPARGGRDLPGQFDIALAQPVDVPEPHGHACVPQVDVGVMAGLAGQLPDRAGERAR